MGAWIISKPSWWWPWGTSHWTFSPMLPGDENPNKPPPSVADKAIAGPNYNCPTDGKTYRTFYVPSPDGKTQQRIVDFSQPI
jgi:hypothetical protein